MSSLLLRTGTGPLSFVHIPVRHRHTPSSDPSPHRPPFRQPPPGPPPFRRSDTHRASTTPPSRAESPPFSPAPATRQAPVSLLYGCEASRAALAPTSRRCVPRWLAGHAPCARRAPPPAESSYSPPRPPRGHTPKPPCLRKRGRAGVPTAPAAHVRTCWCRRWRCCVLLQLPPRLLPPPRLCYCWRSRRAAIAARA